jgi:predicted anti-sigma-YlaC factor YlaD
MQCPDLEQLGAFQTDAVDAAQRRRIAEHVAACDACRRELAAMDSAIRVVSTLPEPAIPVDLWPGIAARIAPHPHPVATWWRALAGAGVLATLLVGSVLVFRTPEPLPVASAEASSFVTRHEFLTTRDPLADRASLAVRMISQEERP